MTLRSLGSKVRFLLVPLLMTVVLLVAGVPLGWFQRSARIPEVDFSQARDEVKSAIAKARDEVKANPHSAAAWGKLGMVLRANDFDTESVQVFRIAEDLDPKDPRWPYLQGLTLALFDPPRALECLSRAAQRSPEDRPEPRYRLAELLLDLGKTPEAEEVIRPILQQSPRDPRSLLLSARAASLEKNWMEVLARTDSLRQNSTTRKRASLMRVEAFRETNRGEELQKELEQLVQLPEDQGWVDRYVREVESFRVEDQQAEREASRYFASGNVRAGVAVLQRAISADANNRTARLMLAQVMIENGNYPAARKLAGEVLQLDPNSVEGCFRMGVAQFLAGDNPAALESFTRLVKLKPDHALGHFNLGHVRKKLGDRKGAIEAFTTAIRCRPDYDPWRLALAELQNDQ